MQIDIRKGELSDREWLYSLYSITMRPYVEKVWGWDEEVQAKGFDEQLGAENFNIVSVDGFDIGGYCVRQKKTEFWLDMILIEPEKQNCGLGKQIIEIIHNKASINELPVRLCSIKINPATEFYKHIGYTEYKNDETLSYLEWSLKPKN